ncbi:hypothetical protein GT755_37120 [Herbidospora sp. NEAU-GS84]|uniref:Uncharacterized protein n=1 Tax=Herbidospora solisilvae TaxID=2696284 RepID=A0A7C9NMW9_9ACTN|nr:hypothetical protein [Herbidospora solisilvae]NAS27278.1 hypothetical protein [Herbidospora solisilvae]
MVGRAPRRAAAVLAAVVGSLGVAVMVAAGASAANPVDPCDVNQSCDTVTTTITMTPSPTPSEAVVTVTQTVTPTPTKKPTTPPAQQTQDPPQEQQPIPTVTQEQPVAPPTNDVAPPPAETVPSDPAESEPGVTLAPADPPTGAQPTQGGGMNQPVPETAQVEIRNATPYFDEVTLSRKLAVPAAVLVLLALLAWLIFEGRLRRLAHAAAVRKAGPQLPPNVAMMPYPGYPMQPYGPQPYPYGQPYPPQQPPQQVVNYVPVPYPMPFPTPAAPPQDYTQPYVYQQQPPTPPPAPAPPSPTYAKGYVLESSNHPPDDDQTQQGRRPY